MQRLFTGTVSLQANPLLFHALCPRHTQGRMGWRDWVPEAGVE